MMTMSTERISAARIANGLIVLTGAWSLRSVAMASDQSGSRCEAAKTRHLHLSSTCSSRHALALGAAIAARWIRSRQPRAFTGKRDMLQR